MEERKLVCRRSLELSRAARQKNSEMYRNLSPIPMATTRAKSTPDMRRQSQHRGKKSTAKETMKNIDEFESSMEKRLSTILSGSLKVRTSGTPTATTADSNVLPVDVSRRTQLLYLISRVCIINVCYLAFRS